MIADIAACPPGAADQALDQADGDIKLAVLICLGQSAVDGRAALILHHGNLRATMALAMAKDNEGACGQ